MHFSGIQCIPDVVGPSPPSICRTPFISTTETQYPLDPKPLPLPQPLASTLPPSALKTVTTPGTSYKRNYTACVLLCDRHFVSDISGGRFQDLFVHCTCFGRCCTFARKDVDSNPKVTCPRGHEHGRHPALHSRYFPMPLH